MVEHPETVATAIRIGNPVRWCEALMALDESGGHISAVSDEQILEAYRLVAKTEGIFCEPSSATGLAGIKQAIADGSVDLRGKRVVCVLTGHGLKDPDTAINRNAGVITIDPQIDLLLKAIS
jgi:threonine synthase